MSMSMSVKRREDGLGLDAKVQGRYDTGVQDLPNVVCVFCKKGVHRSLLQTLTWRQVLELLVGGI